MKTFDEWKSSIIGKSINIDGVSGYQCVDVIHSYLKECFGIPVTARGNAIDYWNAWANDKNLKNNFTRIKNTSDLEFLQGDIIIWDRGVYGHIAVATGDGNTSYFYSIDQNWSGKRVVKERHIFSQVKGCLRPKRVYVTSNKTYKLKEVCGVYNKVGGTLKKYENLTTDGKKNARTKKNGANAYLKAGTKVTVQSTILNNGSLWAKIPSGYIVVWHKNIHELRIK